MKVLENKFVSMSAQDLLDAAGPAAGQQISGSADVVTSYEKDLATFFGKRHAITVSSGTVALYCAMRAVGLGPGDEILLPPTAVSMCGLPALLLGASVRFADITPQLGFGLDPAAVEASLTPKTRAVMSVPLWGYPVPMRDLAELCRKRGVVLIEDVSQSHGTTSDGQLLGTFGDVACFSTHERKLITTGEGGFVLTDANAIAEAVQVFKRYGSNDALGLNFKLSALSAAFGRTQVKKLPTKIAARAKVADALREALRGLDWVEEIPVPSGSTQNFYTLVFRLLDGKLSVKKLDRHLADQKILTDTFRYGFRPLFEYPLFKAGAKNCPNAEQLIGQVFTLPCHEGMDASDVQRVAQAMRDFVA
jgi:dTDP-4-amino-4,6-dideoxygalactose transaminase